MLSTPPKPHDEMKVGKAEKGSDKDSPKLVRAARRKS